MYSENRYNHIPYNRIGKSGLKLPAVSLGLWHNFSANDPYSNQLDLLQTAFDHGITHFDLADNYGAGHAEMNFGRALKSEFSQHRDELIISTKAGHLMWDGPYGDWGSRKHILAGLDQSLKRLQLDYVDVFYHHRPDPDTPLEETAEALADTVRQGKALYIGISKYYGDQSRKMIECLRRTGVPCLINQLPFNMLNRKAEESGELEGLVNDGLGAITFSPLAQGLLSTRYLKTIPQDSRAATEGTFLKRDQVTDQLRAKISQLNDIAQSRGQSLAQMALCWNLSFEPVASVLIGASRASQIIENVEALQKPTLSFPESQMIQQILSA